MYSFTYENNGSTTYLVYKVQSNEKMDTMTLGMLTNNKIIGLAPAVFTQMDSQKFIKYNVSAKISVKQFFEGQVNKKRLIGVFTGIVNAVLSAEDYMIDVNSIILDLDYIFSDVSSCETVVICLPVNRQEENNDLLTFFKTIMFNTQFDQTENCDYVAKIINYLNSASAFSVVKFKKVLDDISSNTTFSQSFNQSISSSGSKVDNPISTMSQQRVQRQQNAVPQVSIVGQREQQKDDVTVSSKTVNQSVKVTSQKTFIPQNMPEISDDKSISFMYLMQHYNKENAEIYKAQKAAKKARKEKNMQKPSKVVKQTQGSFTETGVPTNVGFAVPGASNRNSDFAIPGQVSPVSTTINQPQGAVNAQSQYQTSVNSSQSVSQPVYQKPANQRNDLPQSKAMNFGDTTVLGGGSIGETTVLNAVPQAAQIVMPHLIRAKNNEKIMLNKPVFRIGKERSYVDYFVADNTAVSRSHANMISRDGEFFIVDTNSKNHTYVNGTMIQSNAETKIVHGDKIRLANEDFEFKLY